MGNKHTFNSGWLNTIDLYKGMDLKLASKVVTEFGEGEAFLDRECSGRFVRAWCEKHNLRNSEQVAAEFWNKNSIMGRITIEALQTLETMVPPEAPVLEILSKKEVVTALSLFLPLPLADLVYQYQSGIGGVFVRKWGTRGNEPGQFCRPVGVALSAGDCSEVFVLDQGNNRVQVFEPKGTFLREWGSNELKAPTAIAVFWGEVHVLNDFMIKVFRPEGEFVRAYGGQGTGVGEFTRKPVDLAMNVQGDTFVLVFDQIHVFGARGNFIRKHDLKVQPSSGIASARDELFVTHGAKVSVFTETCQFLRSWGIEGSASGQLWGSRGIVISGQEVLVTDIFNHRIQAFRADGTYIKKWDAFGSRNGHFNTPWSVVLSNEGEMFVADSGNSRIQVFFCCHSHALDETKALSTKTMITS